MSGPTYKPPTTTTATTATPPKETKPVQQGANGSLSVGGIVRSQSFGEANEGGIREDEIKAEESSGGFMGGFMENIASSVAAALNPKNTNLEDLPGDLLDMITDGTMLRFAFGPEDMSALALGDEQTALEAVAKVLTINNPSPAVMEYLIHSDKFTDLIWSGHGSDQGLFTTGADGKADLMENDTISKLLEGSTIDEVFLAVCNGGKELDQKLNEAGLDTYAYDRKVDDGEAIDDLAEYAEAGSLENVKPHEIVVDGYYETDYDALSSGYDPYGFGYGGYDPYNGGYNGYGYGGYDPYGYGNYGGYDPYGTQSAYGGGNPYDLPQRYVEGYTVQAGGNHRRGQRMPDLSGIDFSKLDFSGFGFGAFDFSGLDLSGLNLGANMGTPAAATPAPAPAPAPTPAAPAPTPTTSETMDQLYGANSYDIGTGADLGMLGYSLNGYGSMNYAY